MNGVKFQCWLGRCYWYHPRFLLLTLNLDNSWRYFPIVLICLQSTDEYCHDSWTEEMIPEREWKATQEDICAEVSLPVRSWQWSKPLARRLRRLQEPMSNPWNILPFSKFLPTEIRNKWIVSFTSVSLINKLLSAIRFGANKYRHLLGIFNGRFYSLSVSR